MICNICGLEITKRKSLAYLDGRACKHHLEVVEAFVKKQESEKKEKEQHSLKSKKIKEKRDKWFENFRDPKTYCWHCAKDGIQQQEYAKILLIGLEYFKRKGIRCDIFFPSSNDPIVEYVKEVVGDKVVLNWFPTDNLEVWQLKQLCGKMEQVASMSGIMYICASCAKNFKLDFEHNNLKLNPEQLMVFSDIVNNSVEETVKKIIGEER